MNGRRSFIKGFGLFGALGAGYGAALLQDRAAQMAGPSLPDANSTTVAEDISHLAPLGSTTLVLTANNKPPPPPPPPSPITFSDGYIATGSSYIISSPALSMNGVSTPNQNNVKMSVGKDDRLWIEVDGKWRRVALDA
jgi:hypothetical protein